MGSKYLHDIIGLLIILIGVLLLLQNLHILSLEEQLFWGIALIILGGIFLRVYKHTSSIKSLLILGIIFLLVGLFTSLDAIFFFPGDLIATAYLWFGGAIFISIYIHKNERWWAIIAGGIFIVLGVIVAINAFRLLEGDILWFIFLSGTSLIFWFLYLTKDEKNRLNWTIYPALLLAIFSFFILSLVWENQFSESLFPISIILCGAYLVLKNLWKKKQILPEP
jgi:hypothetical protein